MTTDKAPMVTDLSEEDRKLAEKYVGMLPHILKQCEAYSRDYAGGKVNFLKFLAVMMQTEEALDEVVDELSKIHGLRPRIVPPISIQ